MPRVGGPLLLVLVFAATMIGLASTLLYGGVNEVAVASGTLILGEMLMVVVAPFALAPIVQARIAWSGGAGRKAAPPYPGPWGCSASPSWPRPSRCCSTTAT